MKYIVCEKTGQFELKEKAALTKKAGAALLKIKQVGICGTNLHAYGDNQAFFSYPRILGHELAAEILERGAFPTDSFITHRVPFTEMIANFDSWLKPETGGIKAMVSF